MTVLVPLTLAHTPVARSDLWSAWRPDPLILGILALTALLYRSGLAHLGARRRQLVRPVHVAAFAGALLALAIALASPLDLAASSVFTAHMIQHLLLMLVVAPLLVYGRPVMVLGQAMPLRGRRLFVRVRARPSVRSARDALFHPVSAWVIAVVVLWAWHLPTLYEAALRRDALHALEHASLIATAALVWALALGRTRRSLAIPAASGLLLATALQSGALGAVLALAQRPLYSIHASVAPSWGLTPLEDQQLAGGLMWVPPGIVYTVVIAALMAHWLGSLDVPDGERAATVRGPS
jgi:cytochrome c oxidase assembly factor CtaG